MQVKLVGAESCRRYKLMREMVLEEASRLDVAIELVEETDAEGILKYRTVNLPLLFIGGEKVAQGNPPSHMKLKERLSRPG